MTRSRALLGIAGTVVAVGAALALHPVASAAGGLQPGAAYGWGGNMFGQAGSGAPTNQYNTPRQTVLPDGVVQVQSGGRASYARFTDGRLLSWGYNMNAALGSGSTTVITRYAPAPVVGIGGTGTLTDVVDVSVHMESAIAAVLADGTVVAWGSNVNRQLGDGSTANVRAYPERVLTAPETPLTGVVDVESGWEVTYALMADGTVTAWGSVKCDGTLSGVTQYATPVAGLTDIRQIAVAGGVALFRRGDGAVLSCGGTGRALGRPYGPENTPTSPYTPALVTNLGPGSDVADISISSAVTALTGDGRVYLWGENTQNQLTPLGVSGGLTVPTELAQPAGEPKIIDVDNDNSPMTYAVRADGSVLVWGYNQYGMAGIGTTAALVNTPTVVTLPGRTFASIAASNWTVLAVTVPAA
ncbi:RCC1-like domain-containing protein [Micromonospora mangrovi]|uniref:Alpha-tubulin suppressor-like RCC1 family protein n=2 Tax=Micromonospora TaxID=1873 RepID=A0AAU7ME61_9ACTN